MGEGRVHLRTIFIFMVANSLEILFILSYRVGANGVRKTLKGESLVLNIHLLFTPLPRSSSSAQTGFPQLSVSAVKTEECNTIRRLALVLRVRI